MSKDVLEGGSELHRGDYLMAKNTEWKAVFQHDAHFVIYGWKPVWASDTYGMDPTRLCMQEDCNLVMYNDEDKPRWHTNTSKGSLSVFRDRTTLHLKDQTIDTETIVIVSDY
uniref:Bulb-type lectin domain-containing protein n=1 Tax=Takifugu rubripes TaxID=31033 RepID=A0A3B5KJ27_TAKRU